MIKTIILIGLLFAMAYLIVYVYIRPYNLFLLKRKSLLNVYWIRSCTGKEWHRQFPGASKAAIRDFLQIFVDAFLFDPKDKLKFKPNDKIIDVYDAVYPEKCWGDTLEFVYFVDDIKDKYGIDLDKLGKEGLTLGEIFEMTIKASHQENRGDRE